MSKISKVMVNDRLAKADQNVNDPDVIECISVNGVIIDLRDVSHSLRREYHAASRRVGRHDKARDELQRVGERILAEQLPNLALKYASPRFSGKHAAGKLLGIGLKK
jgi:hypothetical protein